jgi:chaperonin GroEL (HSP60 family)
MEAAAQMMSDVYGEALAACILNMFHGQLQVAAVKAPKFGDYPIHNERTER